MSSRCYLALLTLLCACGSGWTGEQQRVHAHLTQVERELHAVTPPGLTAEQLARRAVQLDRLAGYAAAGRYPLNTSRPGYSPVFIDERGARCAVGALLTLSGHGALAERISRERNFARVAELADLPELVRWLDQNGLTLEEAGRIQPAYGGLERDPSPTTVLPQASVHAGGLAGNAPYAGLAAGGLLGVRVGLSVFLTRWHEPGADDWSESEEIEYSSYAVFTQYERAFVSRGAAGDVFGLLASGHRHHTRDVSTYLVAGLLLSAGAPAFQAGLGHARSWNGLFDVFAELSARGGATFYGGVLSVGFRTPSR